LFNDTNIQPYFDYANYFKDIFKLFSNVLKIKEKKTAANSTYTTIAATLNALLRLLRVAAKRYVQFI